MFSIVSSDSPVRPSYKQSVLLIEMAIVNESGDNAMRLGPFWSRLPDNSILAIKIKRTL